MVLPTVILPGYLANAQPYREMEAALTKRGFPAVTVPLSRRDWFPTLGGRSIIDIVRALDATAQKAMVDYDCDQINLVGHSAGGWISRIYLGDVPYDIHQSDRRRTFPHPARDHVSTLLTLGTPHSSQERWTQKNLNFVNQAYPGAFYADVNYVCVAGKSVEGKRSDWFTFNSYKITSGDGFAWGDGIVPVSAAHLEGAQNKLLEKVWHSPRPNRLWYGSNEAVEQWSQWLN